MLREPRDQYRAAEWPRPDREFDTIRGEARVVEFEFHPEQGLVRIRFSGALKGPETRDTVRALVRDPRYTTGMNGLVDLHSVEAVELFGEDVRGGARMVSRIGAAFAGSRWAFVASSDPAFGVSRQFELMLADPRFEVRAFRTIEEAERWLREER
jgi:hypothetical protein